jgi:hypothetical protein
VVVIAEYPTSKVFGYQGFLNTSDKEAVNRVRPDFVDVVD